MSTQYLFLSESLSNRGDVRAGRAYQLVWDSKRYGLRCWIIALIDNITHNLNTSWLSQLFQYADPSGREHSSDVSLRRLRQGKLAGCCRLLALNDSFDLEVNGYPLSVIFLLRIDRFYSR